MQIISTQRGPISLVTQGLGPPIVLLHGIQGTARTWDLVAPLLGTEYSVIAPNLRGRSRSLIPEDAADYRLVDFADDLAAVLSSIGRPVVLVAWSMGVSVVLELIRQGGGQSIRGQVFASGTPCAGNEACWFKGTSAADVAQEAKERGKRLSLLEAAEPHAVAASWLHVRQADFRGILPQVAIPTLVVHGAEDDQCPVSHGRLIAERIPLARLDEWADTGHNPMAKDAARFVTAINNFAKTI
jgi:pimeloyl-ACP methyl ester carboxylesterase